MREASTRQSFRADSLAIIETANGICEEYRDAYSWPGR